MHFTASARVGRTLRARFMGALAAVLLLAACGDGTGSQDNPTPGVTSLTPAAIASASPAFTLTVNGTGFVEGAVVRWNGQARPTTFVGKTRLTAAIPATDVATAGTGLVTVLNPAPGGGVSNAMELEVSPVAPATLTSLQPDTLHAGVGGTVAVMGTGFVPGSRVLLGSTFFPATTVVSSSEVRFSLSAQNVPSGGFLQVSVLTPDSVPSNWLVLNVANPVPVVTSYTPTETVVEQDSLVVRFTGSGFVPGTRGYVGGTERVTRRISPTEVHVVLTVQDLSMFGTRQVSLVNHQPGGGAAGGQVLVVNPAPVISAAAPAQALATGDSLVVRLTGTGFVPWTQVRLNGSPRESRRTSRTEVEVVLTENDLSTPGTYALTAYNPEPGGGTSPAASITLTPPAPVITTLPTRGATAGGGGFELTVHGTGFVRTSRVRWNGADRPTRWISSTRLQADVAAADVATPRTASVTVATPGAAASNAVQVAVRTPGAATVSQLTLELPSRGLAWDAGRSRLYASVGAAGGARANNVVAIDPATGGITGSVAVGGDPGALAISDDGSTLWVALDATREVLRLALPSLTPGTRFSTGDFGVEDMQVMPGSPGTVVVSLKNSCCSPRHQGVHVYDNGVRRPRSTDSHIGANRIVFGESAAVVYGAGTESSPAYFFTIGIQPDGAVMARETTDVLSGANGQIRYGGGRVYSSLGIVADAARHQQVAYIPDAWAHSSVAVDVGLGRVFYIDTDTYSHTLQVFDINTFQRLGTVGLNGPGSQHPFTVAETLLRWGTDGLALSDGAHVHIFRTPLAGP